MGTCRISRGWVLNARGTMTLITVTGISSELTTMTLAGSTACSQQPHVTQVGGHVPRSRPGCSMPVHGSPTNRVATPEALNVSTETMMARTNRRTT